MTDQLEVLFADLRADAVPAVRPPGTDAARHTVRRRRRTRQASVAAVVLAIAGGVTWTGYAGGDRPAPGANSAAVGGSLMADARAAVERVAPGTVPPLVDYGLYSQKQTTAVTHDGDFGVNLPPGAYLLYAACVSNASGMLLADVTQPDHPGDALAFEWVPCHTAAEVTAIRFRVLKRGLVAISLGANITQGGEAGYAYRIVPDPQKSSGPGKTAEANATRASNRLLAESPGGSVQKYTGETDLSGWQGKFGKGTRYLRLTCAGPGTVQVTSRFLGVDGRTVDPDTGPGLASGSLQCGAEGTSMMKLTLPLPSDGWVGIELEPDALARNQAGFATAIDLS